MPARVRLGELLVTAHIITREQLDEALAIQKEDGRRLGKLLVERGLVTETQLTQILSQQLSVPWVSLYHIDFSRQLLDLVPEELAEEHCLIPIFVRRVRGQGETLYIAMDDPTNEAAVTAIGEFSGLPVRTMIAPPSDIRSAIRAYYGSGDDEGEALTDDDVSRAPSVSPPKVQSVPAGAPTTASSAAPVAVTPDPPSAVPSSLPSEVLASEPPPDSSPTIEAREVSMPAPARRSTRRMVTLTLLDGTQVNLPARSTHPPKPDASGAQRPVGRELEDKSGALTARDLVAALRAVTHGADASEILGDQVRWEPLFAALLEVLMKKHLIADWEFVEEFRKI